MAMQIDADGGSGYRLNDQGWDWEKKIEMRQPKISESAILTDG